MSLTSAGAKLACDDRMLIAAHFGARLVTAPRPDLPLHRLASVALAYACLGAPLAAQDGPNPMVVTNAVISVAVAGVPGGMQEVRPVRDAQIIVARLPLPGDRVGGISDDAVAGPGTMLMVLGGVMLWIAGRRR
jgi:hypothetical protein